MQLEVVLSLVRQIAIFAGGFLTASGIMTATQIELVTGFLISVIPAIWGLISKWKDQQVKQTLITEKRELKAELRAEKAVDPSSATYPGGV